MYAVHVYKKRSSAIRVERENVESWKDRKQCAKADPLVSDLQGRAQLAHDECQISRIWQGSIRVSTDRFGSRGSRLRMPIWAVHVDDSSRYVQKITLIWSTPVPCTATTARVCAKNTAVIYLSISLQNFPLYCLLIRFQVDACVAHLHICGDTVGGWHLRNVTWSSWAHETIGATNQKHQSRQLFANNEAQRCC